LFFGETEEFNFSSFNDVWFVKSWSEISFRLLFVAPIVCFGLFGNSTIIYSMLKFKGFRKKPTNIFIMNMAIADLLTTIVCPNAALFTNIYQFYPLGPFICRFEGFVKITCLLVSAYSLSVLSFDWLICVVKPCRKRITIKKSWLTLVTIWLISISMATPLLIWRRLQRRRWKDLVEVWCCEQLDTYSKYYWLGITFFLIYLPTIIMTIVLVIILLQMDKFEAKLRKSRQIKARQRDSSQSSSFRVGSIMETPTSGLTSRMATDGHPSSLANTSNEPNTPTASIVMDLYSNGSTTANSATISSMPATSRDHCGGRHSSTGGQSSLEGSLSISMKYRRRILKILFAYLLSSIICWSPLQFFIIYRHFRTQAEAASWMTELAFWTQLFASISGATNPIIFGFLSQPFRKIVTKSWMFRLLNKFWSSSSSANLNNNNIPNNENNNNNDNNNPNNNSANRTKNRRSAQNELQEKKEIELNQRKQIATHKSSLRQNNPASTRKSEPANQARQYQARKQHQKQVQNNSDNIQKLARLTNNLGGHSTIGKGNAELKLNENANSNEPPSRQRHDCDIIALKLTLDYVEHINQQQSVTGSISPSNAINGQIDSNQSGWRLAQAYAGTSGESSTQATRQHISSISQLVALKSDNNNNNNGCNNNAQESGSCGVQEDRCGEKFPRGNTHCSGKELCSVNSNENASPVKSWEIHPSSSSKLAAGSSHGETRGGLRATKKATSDADKIKRVSFNTGAKLLHVSNRRPAGSRGGNNNHSNRQSSLGQENVAYQDDSV